MTYQERFYRDEFSTDRFKSFSFAVEESDLWIGVDNGSFCASMNEFCRDKVVKLRNDIKNYIKTYPEFKTSLEPLSVDNNMPGFAKDMIIAGNRANVGPMAAIAGYFAGFLGRQMLEKYEISEMVIENGGDIFVKVKDQLSVLIYAGESYFSGKVGVKVPPGIYGICTSAGTVGHSYSQGNADGVMVVCRDITLADAFATSFANNIKNRDDVASLISLAKTKKEVLSCLAIYQDKIGACGEFEVVFSEGYGSQNGPGFGVFV